MAFPAPLAVAGANSGGNVTQSDVDISTLVGVPDVGELVIISIVKDGTGSFTWPASPAFTQIAAAVTAGGGSNQAVLESRYRIWQSGDSTTVSITHASESTAWEVVRIAKETYLGAPEGNTANGSSTNPDPASFDPSWGTESTLWIAVAGNDGNVAITAGPTSYYSFRNDRVAASTGSGIAIAVRENYISAENPGTFTMSTEQWGTYTIGVRPLASGKATIPVTNTVACTGTVTEGTTKTGTATIPVACAQASTARVEHLAPAITLAVTCAGTRTGSVDVFGAATVPVVASVVAEGARVVEGAATIAAKFEGAAPFEGLGTDNPTGYMYVRRTGYYDKLGQGFKPDASETGKLTGAVLYLSDQGAAHGYNVWVEVWSDSAGAPNAVIGTSTYRDTSVVPSQGWVPFVFETPVSIVGDTQYYLALNGDWPIDAGSGVGWHWNSGDLGADRLYRGTGSPNCRWVWGGGQWINTGLTALDHLFWVLTPEPLAQGFTRPEGTATVAVTAALSGSGVVNQLATATLATTCAVTCEGSTEVIGAATLAVQAGITASANVDRIGAATIASRIYGTAPLESCDSPDGNPGGYYGLRDSSAREGLMQAFMGPSATGSTFEAKAISVHIQKVGSPTGNIWAELWVDTGLGGSPAAVVASSANVDVSTIPATAEWVRFDLTTPYGFSIDQWYVALRGDFTVSASNCVYWSVSLEPYNPGPVDPPVEYCWFYSSGTWSAGDTAKDFCFKLNGVVTGSGAGAFDPLAKGRVLVYAEATVAATCAVTCAGTVGGAVEGTATIAVTSELVTRAFIEAEYADGRAQLPQFSPWIDRVEWAYADGRAGAIPVPTFARVKSGAATLAVSCATSSTARVEHLGAVTISAVASVTAAGVTGAIVEGTAVIATAFTVVANGLGEGYGVSGLSPPFTIVAAAQVEVLAAATLGTSVTVLAAGVGQPQATATVPVVCSVTSSAAVQQDATAALAAICTLTSDSAVDRVGNATLPVLSSVTSSGQTQQSASATLATAVSVSTAALVEVSASATVATLCALTSSAAAERVGSATLAISCSLSSAGETQQSAQAQIAVTASVAIAGTANPTGTATLACLTTVTCAGTTSPEGVASIPAVASLSAAAQVEVLASATIAATATLTCSGVTEGLLNGAAQIDSTCALSASGVVNQLATSTLACAASLSAAALVEVVGATATVASSCSLSAAGTREVDGSATIASAAAISCAATGTPLGAATIGTTGALIAAATVDAIGTTTIPVLAAVSCAAALEVSGSASIAAVAAVVASANVEGQLDGVAQLDSSCVLSASAAIEQYATATLSAAASVSASAAGDVAGAASIAVSCAVSATLTRFVEDAAAQIDSTAALAAQALAEPLGQTTIPATFALTSSAAHDALASATLPALATLTAQGSVTGLVETEPAAAIGLSRSPEALVRPAASSALALSAAGSGALWISNTVAAAPAPALAFAATIQAGHVLATVTVISHHRLQLDLVSHHAVSTTLTLTHGVAVVVRAVLPYDSQGSVSRTCDTRSVRVMCGSREAQAA